MCRKVYHTQQGNVRRGRLYFTLLTNKTQGIGFEDLHAGARARAAAGEAALCGLPVSHDLHTCQRDQPGFDSDVSFSRRALLEVCARQNTWTGSYGQDPVPIVSTLASAGSRALVSPYTYPWPSAVYPVSAFVRLSKQQPSHTSVDQSTSPHIGCEQSDET